jgi:hypothetical protein
LLILSKVYISSYSMKKEEKRSSTSRWNDTSGVSIVHRATEEERKELTEKMVDAAIKNVKEFVNNERKNSIFRRRKYDDTNIEIMVKKRHPRWEDDGRSLSIVVSDPPKEEVDKLNAEFRRLMFHGLDIETNEKSNRENKK